MLLLLLFSFFRVHSQDRSQDWACENYDLLADVVSLREDSKADDSLTLGIVFMADRKKGGAQLDIYLFSKVDGKWSMESVKTNIPPPKKNEDFTDWSMKSMFESAQVIDRVSRISLAVDSLFSATDILKARRQDQVHVEANGDSGYVDCIHCPHIDLLVQTPSTIQCYSYTDFGESDPKNEEIKGVLEFADFFNIRERRWK